MREFGSYVARAGFKFEYCIQQIVGRYGRNLIIDDLGCSPDKAREAIELLIDNAYRKKKQTMMLRNPMN